MDSSLFDWKRMLLNDDQSNHKLVYMQIIGEIEGHDYLPERVKTTKYEELLPVLARVEESTEIDGLLIVMNSVGGDCSCGLALAEMIASISKPVVSLVIGDSHSIGVPVALAADYTFIAPTATMIIHPVRLNGTVIGAPQTFEYFQLIQDRILNFMVSHSNAQKDTLEKMMMKRGIMARDLGTILVGEEAKKAGLVHEVGGIEEALTCLHQILEEGRMQS